MKNSDKIYAIVVFATILLLLLPYAQKKFSLFNERELDGAVVVASNKEFSLKSWILGEYALAKEKYLNDNFGFRKTLVRVHNQIYYSFFNKLYAREVVIGKQGYLYELKYLEAYAGLDYIGTEKTKILFEKIRFLQDTLEKKGKKLLLVFAPSKASYFAEYIPSQYHNNTKQTNYYTFLESAKKYNINHIDFNGYFKELKQSSKYPLYPKTGTHWSVYGMHVAADSLGKYISKLLNKPVARFDYSEVEVSDSLRSTDGDLSAGLNLYSSPSYYAMGYPKTKWLDQNNQNSPRVLTLADSYWMGVFMQGFPHRMFSSHQFWYYNQEVNSTLAGASKNIFDHDLIQTVDSMDLIMIVSTEATLKQIGWGFIDELYEIYSNPAQHYTDFLKNRRKNSEIHQMEINIRNDPDWYKNIIAQAKSLKITEDSCLRLNAEYMYEMNH